LIKQAEAALNSWTYAVVIDHPGDAAMKVKVYGAVHEAEQPRHILTTARVPDLRRRQRRAARHQSAAQCT